MKRYLSWTVGIAALVCILNACIEPFSPPEVNSIENHLVVDGFLNVGTDTSRIDLRRTQNVNAESIFLSESGASLMVESESGEQFAFTEIESGSYILEPHNYNRADQYRLRIKTLDGKEYLSEYVKVTITPPIDSIAYRINDAEEAAVFYVNTHDDVNHTQFYRWKFEETWEYHSAYRSFLEVINQKIIYRTSDVSECWRTSPSGSILLGSTVKLSSDIIKDLPLFRVPIATNKLFYKYSVLVKQYGLSREAFEYWTNLSKTTQGTGSLFDPQPSQVTGNILSTGDKSDLVFGYFSASTEQTKRLTISPRLGDFARCSPPDTFDIVCSPMSNRQCALETSALLISYGGERSEYILGAAPGCVDCRTLGGTTTKPGYW